MRGLAECHLETLMVAIIGAQGVKIQSVELMIAHDRLRRKRCADPVVSA